MNQSKLLSEIRQQFESQITQVPAILGGPAFWPQGAPARLLPRNEIADQIARALQGDQWAVYEGGEHAGLREDLAQRFPGRRPVLTSSGTVAIELALRAAGVGPGDEVLLAAYDFEANFKNVLAVGALPVLVDVVPECWTIDPLGLEAADSPRVKALIASHLHGQTPDWLRLRDLCQAREVVLIEDACQSPARYASCELLGAEINGESALQSHVGEQPVGEIVAFSFGGSKPITAGRGGAVLLSTERQEARLRLYTQRGNEAYPLSELQALVVRPQWRILATQDRHRWRQAMTIEAAWDELCGQRHVSNDRHDESFLVSLYKLGLWYEPEIWGGLSRARLVAAARAEGLPLAEGFQALHETHSSKRYRHAGDLVHASAAGRNVLQLHHTALSGSEEATREVMAILLKLKEHADQLQRD
ncbi:DegT/DnrJ/EryC1/StrS aminotransferase [Planctopirus limnophila DSM 3776]|uniref:DegT/DnrJ/EryC1/StrS aminotransferase n=1 Tax=Planctopirus limnophila (strain ATCC 43296 / DSM 3776 / IFAM 1008 / Mu 290) TaxID=521674 RepID=D5SR93_PLAL2|nr:DegT/DnrJ/EryC1/StrS aminotransferase [Planctopirus limnophila DSM 3776]